MFPDGIMIDPASRQYRTCKIQSLFSYIVYLTIDTEGQKKDSPIKNTDESSLVAGTGLSFISFRMDINGGLTKKSSDHFVIFLFSFPFTY